MDTLTPYLIAALFGLVIGSFLNVCIYRLPRGESVVWPPSHCPACARPIAWYHNIPLLGFVVLLGRCRACRAPISWRYPLVEVANALGYVLLVGSFGVSWTSAFYGVLLSALIVVTGTDLSHRIIPNVITYPGIGLGLIGSLVVLPVGIVNSLLGVLVGGGLLWFLAWLSPYIFGKEGMGGGDIKLIAMVGAFLGWKSVLLTILIGSFVGSIVGGGLIAMNRLTRREYIPFGPFLALGAVLSLFFHEPLLAWYWGLFDLTR